MAKVNVVELEEALYKWRTLASQHGWRESTPDFTIWVDADGHVTDSVGTMDGTDTVYIVRDEQGVKVR